MGRDREGPHNSIMRLMDKIESMSGIPIELEDLYTWIAFIPGKPERPISDEVLRPGEGGWKIGGSNSGSTQRANGCADSGGDTRTPEIVPYWAQALANSIKTCLRRLEMRREVPLIDLVIRRRVKKDVAGTRSRTLLTLHWRGGD